MKENNVEQERSAILFRLGNETFAFPAPTVQLISQAQKIHGLPHQKNALLKGVLNMDGQLKIALSLHHLLNITETPSPKKCLLVGEPGDDYVFLVDELLGMTTYSTLQTIDRPYLQGILPPSIHLIDKDHLFAHLRTLFHA